MRHVLVVFGTRPELIKLAPVIERLRTRPRDARVTLCSTGQHRSMLDDALGAFGLKADIDLRLMREAQPPADIFGRLMLALDPVIRDLAPDVLLVQGDTATVAAAALTGFLGGVCVAHVEAGLRTRDRRCPFPEEANRRIAGAVADLHFAPTRRARENLLAEGVPAEHVYLTGNTIVDALRGALQDARRRPLPENLRADGRRLVLVTAHRRESFGPPLRELCLAMRELVERFDDVLLLYPVHLNPSVQAPVREILGGCPRVRLVEPLPYHDFVALLDRACLVLTDSGGVQEEAPALGKPTLVMRDKTERPEGLDAGIVRLVGTDRRRLVHEATRLLANPAAYAEMARAANVYGDGLAAARIGEVLIDGRMSTPPFDPP